jgi:hypothetical protein
VKRKQMNSTELGNAFANATGKPGTPPNVFTRANPEVTAFIVELEEAGRVSMEFKDQRAHN